MQSQIKLSFFTKLFLILTKFALTLIMLFSIVLLFFVGSGVIKPAKSWAIITTEGSMK